MIGFKNCKKIKALILNNYKYIFSQTQMIELFIRFILQQFSVFRTTKFLYKLKIENKINIKNYTETKGFI